MTSRNNIHSLRTMCRPKVVFTLIFFFWPLWRCNLFLPRRPKYAHYPGNVLLPGEPPYADHRLPNVHHTVVCTCSGCADDDDCNVVGDICCPAKKVCETPPDPVNNPGACGEKRRISHTLHSSCQDMYIHGVHEPAEAFLSRCCDLHLPPDLERTSTHRPPCCLKNHVGIE